MAAERASPCLRRGDGARGCCNLPLRPARTSVARSCRGPATAGNSGFAPGDATIAADVQRVTKAAVSFLGGLDTIVVSAGAGGRTPIFDTPVEEFQRIIDHSLLPPFLAMRFAAEHLLAGGKASVIVVSSMYGLVGQKERVGYCAGKAGVIGLSNRRRWISPRRACG